MKMKEVRKIKGFEDIKLGYYVLEDGRVISYRDNGGNILDTYKVLKQYEKTGGYLYVALVAKENKVKYIRVHRLVASACIKTDDYSLQVNHKDEDKHNNHCNNLEWLTPSQNSRYSNAKKVYKYSNDGKFVCSYQAIADCKKHGFNPGHVGAVCRNEERAHKSYLFSFKKLTKSQVIQRLSKDTFYLK